MIGESVRYAGGTPGAPGACRAVDRAALDAGQQLAWRELTTLIHLLPAALDRRLQECAGIPHTYYVILAMLSEAPGRSLRMSQLAECTATSQSRLSHAVARLSERGWVRRRRCPTDGRGQNATLTDDGYRMFVGLAPQHVAEVRRLVFGALTPEQVEQLRRITAAITSRITAGELGEAGDRGDDRRLAGDDRGDVAG